MNSIQNTLHRCGAFLNEPRYAVYVYCASLLLYSLVQAVSILCIVLAWTSPTSEAVRALFVICVTASVAMCQCALNMATHRWLAPRTGVNEQLLVVAHVENQ